MPLAELLERYGYLAIVIGTFLEGETVLIMAGFLAHRGYLTLAWVMLAGFAGSLLGDQTAFFLGRRYGARLIGRSPHLARGIPHARRLLSRYGTALLLGFRFIYGIRNVVPITAGMSGIPLPRFLALNMIGAGLWACAVGAAGFAFGQAFESVLDRARHYELYALAALFTLGMSALLLRHFVRSRRDRRSAMDPGG